MNVKLVATLQDIKTRFLDVEREVMSKERRVILFSLVGIEDNLFGRNCVDYLQLLPRFGQQQPFIPQIGPRPIPLRKMNTPNHLARFIVHSTFHAQTQKAL